MLSPLSHPVESLPSSYSPPPCRQFTFSEIEHATQNFDESLVIGRGGFGKVYRGTITYGETLLNVAVKRLESGSNQGAIEFRAEIETLSKLRHCHLVSLLGYSNDQQEMILVYEYMPHGTLVDRLHKRGAPLTWVRRLKICIGAARGLDYLHSDMNNKPRVIHRDVKSSNILLDENWAAKISDFGLSKIGPTNQPSTYVKTSVRGTFGYLDPDYFQTGRLTRKSDVYAFGVVLFEVLCGKQAVDRSIDEDHWGLATWAQDSIKEGRLKQIVDSNIRDRISPKCLKEFAQLADRCLHSRPKQRPVMAEVVVGLESILDLQEKTDSTLVNKRFSRMVPAFLFPSNWDNSVGGTSLKELEVYLYTVGGEDRIVHRFEFSAIVYATENFQEANKLLTTSYLSMYKGRLQTGQGIAIAQYRIKDEDTAEQVMNEASMMVKFEHENMILLLGYCIHGTEVYLIYDFAPNATLDRLIFDPTWNLLDLNRRYKIILGVARVLLYLHNHTPIQIIHGYVSKVDNICRAMYMVPEHIRLGYLYADVYSFGMLILETVAGFDFVLKAYNQQDDELQCYVGRNWLEGTLSDIIDPRINVDPNLMTKLVEIGLLCVQGEAADRPTMEEVVDMLLDTSPLTLHVSEILRIRMNYIYFKDWESVSNVACYGSEDEEVISG